MADSPRWLGAAIVLVSALGFSAKAIFIKLAYRFDVDAVTLLALRMLLAAPLFAAVAWWDARRGGEVAPLTQTDALKLAALGLVGYYLASLFDFIGLQYISAALERLILFLYPTFVVIASAFWFKHRITRREILALVLSYSGIVLAVGHDLKIAVDDRAVWVGGAWVLLSAICFAGYIIGNGELGRRIGSVRLACYASLASCLFIVVHFALVQGFAKLSGLAWQVWALSLGMAAFSTVMPIVLMSVGIRMLGSSRAAMLSAFGPVATMGLGYVFLGEVLSLWQIVGAALVVAGVMVITLGKRD